MRNLKMSIEYDGSGFYGWQIQPGLRTVQGILSECLSTILREEIRLTGAGRTDAGVHALGQVANFSTSSRMAPESVRKRVNSMLPEDVTVRELCTESRDFHSRYDAKSKVYRYKVIEGRSPLRRRQAWEVKYTLNPEWMNASAQYLVGERDLSSFTVEPKGNNLVCLSRARWRKVGDEFHFEVEANRFLHKMVRMMAGRMVEIGRGRWSPDTMEELVEKRQKGVATPTAPAHGLCLLRVKY